MVISPELFLIRDPPVPPAISKGAEGVSVPIPR
jgi:hypothetical protein